MYLEKRGDSSFKSFLLGISASKEEDIVPLISWVFDSQ